MNHSSIGEIFHIDCQGEGGSPGGIGPGTVPALRLHKRRNQAGGRSFLQIKRGLEADGVLNGAGHAKWHESNIKQILTNEKYIGDALLQKTYTVNTLEKKRVSNNGLAPKYYVEGSHEAIIDKDVFLRVQAEIARRANILTDGKKRVYSSRYALSSLVFCGHCGDIFRRVKWNNRGCKSTVWRCVSRVLKKSSGIDCPARTIHEEDLQAAVVTTINDACGSITEYRFRCTSLRRGVFLLGGRKIHNSVLQ